MYLSDNMYNTNIMVYRIIPMCPSDQIAQFWASRRFEKGDGLVSEKKKKNIAILHIEPLPQCTKFEVSWHQFISKTSIHFLI